MPGPLPAARCAAAAPLPARGRAGSIPQRAPPCRVHNAAWPLGSGQDPPLQPALASFLRSCPLLPSELARVEAQLCEQLSVASAEVLGRHVGTLLRDTEPASRPAALDQALRHAEQAWRHECARVAAALVSGLGRLHCRRAAGIALYAIANAALGERGAQLLAGSQLAMALPRLLQDRQLLPWLHWLCQLPLPSLRGGVWVEPLLALLPSALEAMLQPAVAGHALLRQPLQLPTSTLRLLLLATTWALWFRQASPPAPATTTGRRLARMPAVLDQLDLVGTAAQRVFAAPDLTRRTLPEPAPAVAAAPVAAAAESTRLLRPAPAFAVAMAASLPALSAGTAPRRAVAAVAGLAAAGAGAAWIASTWENGAPGTPVAAASAPPLSLSQPQPSRRSPRSADADPGRAEATAQDRAALIDALWSLRDSAVAGGEARVPRTAFVPAEGSSLALALQRVREQLLWLYRQDDFLQRLYAERTPPSTLWMANATLGAARVNSGTAVVLHPLPPAEGGDAWSAPTGVLLDDLQRRIDAAGGCFDNSVPARLDCALGFYAGHALPTTPQTPHAIDRLILGLEQVLHRPAGGEAPATNETATLLRLRQQVLQLKAMPIRGLEPNWRGWRPDPRSHLGHNMALARSLLLQVSAHAEVIALCWHHHADPAQLVYPAHGAVLARALQGTRTVALFDAGQPPAALSAIDTLLRGIATLLHAPVRSNGQMQVPEMLAYYAAPLPAAPMDDAPFDACLAILDRQLAPPPVPAPEPRHVDVAWDTPVVALAAQDAARLLHHLWERFDARLDNGDDALAQQRLAPAPGSPIHTAWRDAQHQLRQVFEQPAIWAGMRRLNASFHSLRVATDGITARERGSGRSVIVVDGLAGTLEPSLARRLEALYRMTDRLGRFSPGSTVPLTNALQFHGALPRPAASACAFPLLCTQAHLLHAIARVHEDWQRRNAAPSRWHQASHELQELRPLLARDPAAATRGHRAALGTTTATTLQPALSAFAELLALPAVQASLPSLHPPPLWISVDADGSVVAQDASRVLHPLDPTAPWRQDAAAAPLLATLRDVATQLGGPVRSDGRVNVSDILTAHGGCGPEEETHFDGAARCVERLLGELRLGMRADLLHAWDALDADDLERIRTTTAAFLAQRAPDPQTLLEYLARPLLENGDMGWNQLHRTSYLVASMARTPRALRLQAALLDALGWYAGGAHAPTSPTLLASLTRVAIVLDLGPPSDRDARVLLGYRLHKSSNWGRTFAQIRLDFQDYLHSMGRIPSSALGMATALALQDHAPELLATDVPANLVYANTIASIQFVSGVHLAERIRRGLSQQMRFGELLSLSSEFAEGVGVPDLVKQMTLQARRLPTHDWYVFRQLERGPAPPLQPSGRIEAALLAFDQRVAAIERAVADVLAPLPYRMPLLEAEIRRVFPRFPGVLAGHAWNSTEFLLCHDDNHFGRSFPFFEVVAAGALRTDADRWRPCRTFVPDTPLNRAQGNPRYEAALQDAYALMRPALPRLADINARYQRRFDAYFRHAQRGYGVLIEEALYQRPEEERHALMQGAVEVFTLRTHEPDLEARQETRNDTDPYRGRFGVVYTLTLSGQPRHFQLFPLQSRIVPLSLNGPLPLGGELQSRKVRLRSGNMATVQVRRGTPLPVDWEAYATDKAPAEGRSSEVIVERLLTPPHAQRDNSTLASPFDALVEPIQHGFFWLDADSFRREGWAPTGYELHLEDAPLWLKTVDFFVPFVENLRRISSRNRNEFAMAAFGLYLEAIIVVGPVVSGVAKVLARPGLKLTLPRFAELSRVLGHGTLDALNPAAGSLSLLRVGVSVAQRTARGNLRFLWSVMSRQASPAQPPVMRWAMREGMAIAKEGGSLASPLYEIKVRTVDGIPGAMVAPPPVASGSRTLHLVDPATLSLYGPALQERLGESGGAAGMLIKVGGSPRTPHVSPGKALKPIKQGPKASDEEPDEDTGLLQPPVLTLPDHRALGVPAAHP
ncbi:hypothetical protein L0938_02525 [Paracidovorax citrulli]